VTIKSVKSYANAVILECSNMFQVKSPKSNISLIYILLIFVKKVLIVQFQTNQRSTFAISVESTFQAFGYTTNAKSASTSSFAKFVTVKRDITIKWSLWEKFAKVVLNLFASPKKFLSSITLT
jgi:hypothetical protein